MVQLVALGTSLHDTRDPRRVLGQFWIWSDTLTPSAHCRNSVTCLEQFSTEVWFCLKHCSKAAKGSAHCVRIFRIIGWDEVHWATFTFCSWHSCCQVPGLLLTHVPYSSSSLRQYLAVTSRAACMITLTPSHPSSCTWFYSTSRPGEGKPVIGWSGAERRMIGQAVVSVNHYTPYIIITVT